MPVGLLAVKYSHTFSLNTSHLNLLPVWQNCVPICFACDGLLVVDSLATTTPSFTAGRLELKLEATSGSGLTATSKELVEGIEGVIEPAILCVVMVFPRKQIQECFYSNFFLLNFNFR